MIGHKDVLERVRKRLYEGRKIDDSVVWALRKGDVLLNRFDEECVFVHRSNDVANQILVELDGLNVMQDQESLRFFRPAHDPKKRSEWEIQVAKLLDPKVLAEFAMNNFSVEGQYEVARRLAGNCGYELAEQQFHEDTPNELSSPQEENLAAGGTISGRTNSSGESTILPSRTGPKDFVDWLMKNPARTTEEADKLLAAWETGNGARRFTILNFPPGPEMSPSSIRNMIANKDVSIPEKSEESYTFTATGDVSYVGFSNDSTPRQELEHWIYEQVFCHPMRQIDTGDARFFCQQIAEILIGLHRSYDTSPISAQPVRTVGDVTTNDIEASLDLQKSAMGEFKTAHEISEETCRRHQKHEGDAEVNRFGSFPHLYEAFETISHDSGASAGHNRYYVPARVANEEQLRDWNYLLSMLTKDEKENYVLGEESEKQDWINSRPEPRRSYFITLDRFLNDFFEDWFEPETETSIGSESQLGYVWRWAREDEEAGKFYLIVSDKAGVRPTWYSNIALASRLTKDWYDEFSWGIGDPDLIVHFQPCDPEFTR